MALDIMIKQRYYKEIFNFSELQSKLISNMMELNKNRNIPTDEIIKNIHLIMDKLKELLKAQGEILDVQEKLKNKDAELINLTGLVIYAVRDALDASIHMIVYIKKIKNDNQVDEEEVPSQFKELVKLSYVELFNGAMEKIKKSLEESYSILDILK